MTVLKSIQNSYKLLGIPNPTNQDLADALDTLNDMLGNWSINNLTIYVNTRETLTLVISQATYTIGSGGDLSTTRPEHIVDMYLRDATNGNDSYMRPLTEEEYDDIIDKTIESIPDSYFYAPEYPLGKIYLYPVPSDTDTLLITSKKPFASVGLNDSFTLPNGYDAAIKYNLALELAPLNGYEPDQVLVSQARKTLKDIKRKNSTKLAMTVKGNMPRTGKRNYNIYTGDYR